MVLVLTEVVRLKVEDTREAAFGRLVDKKDLNSLALNKTLHVSQYPEDHVLDGALLLENHSGQIQQHLVAFHLQLGLFV